jgi:hypothetical protein
MKVLRTLYHTPLVRGSRFQYGIAQAPDWRSRMIHPVPRSERGDLIAALSLVALLVVSMAIAARAVAWL